MVFVKLFLFVEPSNESFANMTWWLFFSDWSSDCKLERDVKFLKVRVKVKVKMNMMIKYSSFIQEGEVKHILETPKEHNVAYGIKQMQMQQTRYESRRQSQTERDTQQIRTE